MEEEKIAGFAQLSKKKLYLIIPNDIFNSVCVDYSYKFTIQNVGRG
jgi:hypothetical protein